MVIGDYRREINGSQKVTDIQEYMLNGAVIASFLRKIHLIMQNIVIV